MKLSACAAALAIAAISLVGAWVGSVRVVDVSQNGGLILSESSMDFGESPPLHNFVWELQLSNPTDEDVEVIDLKTSCGCVASRSDRFVVPKHGEFTAKLTIDLSNDDPKETHLSVRPVEFRVVPRLASGFAHNPGWIIRGVVLNPFRLRSTTMNFGEIVETQPSSAERVKGTSEEVLQSITSYCDPQLATSRIVGFSPDSKHFEIEVTPSTLLPAGDFEFFVDLEGATPDGQKLRGAPLRVLGSIVHPISIVPATATFGAQPVGSSSSVIILVTSRDKQAAFLITDVDVDVVDAGVSIERLPHEVKGEFRFRIVQEILRPGAQSTEVRFVVVGKDGTDRLNLTLPVSYYGIASSHD